MLDRSKFGDPGIFDRVEVVELLDGDTDLREEGIGIRDGLVSIFALADERAFLFFGVTVQRTGFCLH